MPWPETVLVVHNRYRIPGGEDMVYEAEAALLEERGHRVLRFERHNDGVPDTSSLAAAGRAVWNRRVHEEVRALVLRERPAVVHVHNTLALISPAVHHAARAAGGAVVQTLHNFRLLCPAGTFLRSGRPCEACLGSAVPWPAVRHACYRGGRAASAAVAGMLVAHRLIGTWQRQVDAFIALSEFARDRFLAGGLPADRLHVKGGFLHPDPGVGRHDGADLLFVGRLSEEKGVGTLLDAWQRLRVPARLTVVGDGPMAEQVRAAAAADPRLQWLGSLPRREVLVRMQDARALVLPSVCYENFPTVLTEAFAVGLPVIGARIGSVAELVEDGVTGRHFDPGDGASLAEHVAAVHNLPDATLTELGRNARNAYETRLTADRAYARLIEIYRAAHRVRIAPAAAVN